LVGIALPWVTLIPYIYPSPPLPDVVLERGAFAELLSRTRAGDGTGAYRQLVGSYPWCGGAGALVGIEMLDPAVSEVRR